MSTNQFSLHPLKKEELPNGWKLLPVGKVLVDSQYGTNAASSECGNTAVVGMKDIQNGIVLTTDLGWAKLSEKERPKYLLEKGDILINRTNSYALVGKVGIFNSDDEMAFASYLVRLKVNKVLVCPEYLNYWLNGYIAQKTIKRIATRAISQANINPTEFKKHCFVPLPPPKTQKEIVDILGCWYEAIEKIERLIAAKEKRFQTILYSLMNGHNENWKKVALEQVANILKKEKLTSVENEVLLTVKLHCLGIEKNTRIQPKLTKKGRPYFKRYVGEFLIGRQNFHNGGFGIVPNKFDGLIASNAITSVGINPDKLDIDFLFYFLSRKDYYKKVGHIMDGTGQKELSDKQILKLKISLPSLDQQKQTAEILNTAKQEIDLLKNLADAYRKQKQGLMQKLLTGKWRVKTAGEEM